MVWARGNTLGIFAPTAERRMIMKSINAKHDAVRALLKERKAAAKKTNADRIRAMSDEELANIMAGTPICKERYMDCIKDGRDCEPCLLEWLKFTPQ